MTEDEAKALPEAELNRLSLEKMDEMLRECRSEDDKIGCVTDLLASIPEEVQTLCQPQIVLLTQDGCDACASAKDELHDLLDKGVIKERKIWMGDGKRIAQKNGINTAPALILVNCKDELLTEL